ncbi:hypothetical protein CJF31_00000757 [Rutstroemia sp. NJR-2017a BVV2]|nr:hypothetical protein CJF31_00000757 [Rutstroemia sp. NJR-2017a BVV2]
MFENFTFGAAPTNPYQYDDDQPSPRDDSFPAPLSPSSGSYPFFEESKQQPSPISDIVYQFNQSSFFSDNTRDIPSRQYLSPPPSLCDDSEMSSPVSTTHSMPTTPVLPPSRNGTLACRRLQRQINVQLQSSGAHIRDINTLVEDMLNNNSQCCLRKPLSKSNLAVSPLPSHSARLEVDPDTPDDIDTTEMEIEKARRKWMNTVVHANDIDEGYVEGDSSDKDSEDLGTSLRRASTPSGIRKHGLRCRTSMETVGSGRAKVAKLPRMRIRRQGRVGKVVE